MIHVSSTGDMPFVSNVRKSRLIRSKLQSQSPVKTAKLSLKGRTLEKLNAQDIKRYTLASALADGSVDVKHRSGHLRSALLRIRQTIMHPKFEKLHVRNSRVTSSVRPATSNQIPKKSLGLPPRTYTVCEECSRRCAYLDVITEEDFDEDGLSKEVDNEIKLTPSFCSMDSSSIQSHSSSLPYSNILSV